MITRNLYFEDRLVNGTKEIIVTPNNTPLLEPLDQNVIKSLKQRYRKHLLACIAALGAHDGIFSALKNINLKMLRI